MPRILTVDDSRAIRMIVSKQLQPLGFEISEAEDGNDGLGKLQGAHFDLVVLDVTMPNLDGPGMLAKMRESGNKTPVLMLTSESKTAIVTTLMRLGIADYVLKPFQGEELKAKVLKALKLPADYAPASTAASATAAVPAALAPASPLSAERALVIDDMENVHKKVRSLIPAAVALDTSLNLAEGLSLCRANKYALILVDGELPDANLASLTKQLRLLQTKTVLVAMALRTANNVTGEMRSQGFDDVLFKPFANQAIEALVERCFLENQELVSAQENFVRVAGFHGRDDKLEHYFQRLLAKLKEVTSKLAEACFDSAVLDATQLPLGQPMRAAQFMADLGKAATNSGVALRVVGSAEMAAVVGRFEEAKAVRLFQSVEEARAAA
jgi:two-component system, cell cycle response regulator